MGQCLEPRFGCEGEAGGQALLPRRGEAQCHLFPQPAVSPGDHGQLIRNIQFGNGNVLLLARILLQYVRVEEVD